jgi:hypothetical protein
MDGGRIKRDGTTAEVAADYEMTMTGGRGASERRAETHLKAQFRSWRIVEPQSEPANLLTVLGPVGVRFTLEVNETVRHGQHGIALFSGDHQLMWAWAANHLQLEPGIHQLDYTFPMLPLRPGPYYWQLSIWDDGHLLDMWDCIPELIIAAEMHQHPQDEWSGVLNVPCGFTVSNGKENQIAGSARVAQH